MWQLLQNLFATYSARVVGLEMFADGMPRKNVGFLAGNWLAGKESYGDCSERTWPRSELHGYDT